jgi:hypothetical protein
VRFSFLSCGVLIAFVGLGASCSDDSVRPTDTGDLPPGDGPDHPPQPEKPATPADFRVDTLGDTFIRLAWTDTADDQRSAWTEPLEVTAYRLGYWEVTGGIHSSPCSQSVFFRFGRANRFHPPGTLTTATRQFTADVTIDADLTLPLPEVSLEQLPGRQLHAIWSCPMDDLYWFTIIAYADSLGGGQPAQSDRHFDVQW